MKAYKINRTKTERLPSDEVVKKHQNFNEFKVQYDDVVKRNRVPLYKNKKMFLFIIVLGLLAYILITEFKAEEVVSAPPATEQDSAQ